MHPKLSEESAQIAYWRSGGYCAAPKCGKQAVDNHHIFYTQAFPELADEPDNVIALCRRCHADHHAASHRLPRSVCKVAERLASTPRMEDWLDRRYGVR